MSIPDSSLYGLRPNRRIAGDREISSAATLSFTSRLSSLIDHGKSNPNGSNGDEDNTLSAPSRPRRRRAVPRPDDVSRAPNRHVDLRARRDRESSARAVDGETEAWARGRRRLREKARLYAAMQRGDVEDAEERYAVDFDRKWAEKIDAEEEDDDDEDEEEDDSEVVEYVDEFGRTRRGTRREALQAQRAEHSRAQLAGDAFRARPTAPKAVLHGDAIQHEAFAPGQEAAERMETLARKRDRSATPPGQQHFDARSEVRGLGTGFYAFSAEEGERRRQMQGLEREREETERARGERGAVLEERRRRVEERRRAVGAVRSRRKAETFLAELAGEDRGDGEEAA